MAGSRNANLGNARRNLRPNQSAVPADTAPRSYMRGRDTNVVRQEWRRAPAAWENAQALTDSVGRYANPHRSSRTNSQFLPPHTTCARASSTDKRKHAGAVPIGIVAVEARSSHDDARDRERHRAESRR